KLLKAASSSDLWIKMPKVRDHMELKRVPTEADDDSTTSLDREPIDSEKIRTDWYFPIEQFPGHASFGMSVFNLSNAIMGSGILGLSYAMANTGIVLFTILLIAVAILSLYSVHLLLMTSKEGGSLIYEKLGEKAFGWPGKMAAFGSIIMQNIGAMSSYLFIVKYELPEVIRAFMGLEEISGEWYLNGNYLVVFVSLGVILPLSLLKNLGYLGYTSGINAFLMLNNACGEFVYYVLPIYSELKDRTPKKMQTVSNLSILAMLIMYMLSALFGYLTFYENVEAELLHTFTKVYKFDTLLLLVRLAVLTAVTLTVPIVLFPIRSSITTLLFSGRDFSWIRHMVIAAAILLFNNMLVIFVPTIRDIFGFIGGSAATMLIFILPAAFYLRLVKPRSTPKKVGATVFLIMGIVFMFGSLSLITLDWIHNPPGSKGH
uniref:Solute carrier family 38 member 4 n=1 Tax=Nothobranchius furzeri TaxID=105023 RepID=A0A8C6KA61_NOTFU